ncbi:MAG: pyruvate formate-lyase [Lachnospiraceae bacterium]|nr:pyruvate formate-lyase [Lachnospiraceae bacterium]
MSERLKNYLINREHHQFRRDDVEVQTIAEEFMAAKLCPKERMTRRFERLAKAETPVLLPEEKICFMRTVKTIPDCFTAEEWAEIKEKHYIHELGYLSNLSPDYERIIAVGLLEAREDADEYGKRVIDAIIDLADRYRNQAILEGKTELAAVLKQVPRYGATCFYEALQFFRIIHFSLWLEGNYHNTVGRFDQYMYPYLKADMEKGMYTEESALELVEDFFLSFNKDSDLYPGVQQGDNGQSMVLGGMDENGKEGFNLLSELCLKASKNLMMIDPKINLRVSKNTPVRVYELGSELTKAGLGFPQYSNDDVVIDGLQKLGYELKDARDYVVAACWEFIIPKVGADVANIGALSFPKVIDICLHEYLTECDTFEEFLDKVNAEIRKECDRICDSVKDLWFVPSPFMNVMMDGGIYEGGKYNHFGIHGTGVATAADSLAVIGKYIYEEKRFSKEELIEAVDSDFAKHGELLPVLRYEAPKLGNNEALPDEMLVRLLDMFADGLKGKQNCRGGAYRAGTGSAMYYLWHANEIGASPDGRRKGEPFGTNFSPSLFARIKGPLSVIQSFTKPDFTTKINGGPLTLEFAASMFKDEDSVKKVASLVKAYIDLGGHQMQLNAVNTEKLKAAQANPEEHRQLVVRIWGWSAYFVELDKEYQDHVLRRQQYTL